MMDKQGIKDRYEFSKRIAGEYLCPLNDGKPVTQYEVKMIDTLARFGAMVLNRYFEE